MSLPPENAGEPVAVALLSETIAQHPDEPVNYLLRGECWLAAGAPDEAAADFVAARALAVRRLQESNWSYTLQATIDRAAVGLAACGQRAPEQHELSTSIGL